MNDGTSTELLFDHFNQRNWTYQRQKFTIHFQWKSNNKFNRILEYTEAQLSNMFKKSKFSKLNNLWKTITVFHKPRCLLKIDDLQALAFLVLIFMCSSIKR